MSDSSVRLLPVDVYLEVGQQKIGTNRALLARHSGYFRAMFEHQFSESQQSCVSLKGLHPQAVTTLLSWAAGARPPPRPAPPEARPQPDPEPESRVPLTHSDIPPSLPSLPVPNSVRDPVGPPDSSRVATRQRGPCMSVLCRAASPGGRPCPSCIRHNQPIISAGLVPPAVAPLVGSESDSESYSESDSKSDSESDSEPAAEGEFSSLPEMSTLEALHLLQAAGMLQFLQVNRECVALLAGRLATDCLEILATAELLCEQDLLAAATRYTLCHFSMLITEAFTNCGSDTLRKVLANPRLNCSDESVLRDTLARWRSGAAEEEHVEELVAVWRGVKRRLPLYPAVMAQRPSSELLRRGTEGGAGCRRGVAALMVFLPGGELREVPLPGGEVLEPTGFRAVSRDQEVVVSGGEVHLGHSQWSLGVWSCDTVGQEWRQVGSLTQARRHHAAVLLGNRLYVIGGYGKHRVVLASVESIDLDSGEVRRCCSLPCGVRRPAATVWRGRLLVVGECGILAYKEQEDRWEEVAGASLPPGVSVDCALAAQDGQTVFLTSTCSSALYMITSTGTEHGVELVGRFSSEAGNTCMVGSTIYNFYSEEFGDSRVVESYCTLTDQFAVLLQKDLPGLNFSPASQYSYGCFPLLCYTL